MTNNVAFALGHILVLSGFVRYAMRPVIVRELDYNSSTQLEAADESA